MSSSTNANVTWVRDGDGWRAELSPFRLLVARRPANALLVAKVLRCGTPQKASGPHHDEQQAQNAAIELLREHISEEGEILAKARMMLDCGIQPDTGTNTTLTSELDQIHDQVSALHQRAKDGDAAVVDIRASPVMRYRIEASPEEKQWEDCHKQYTEIFVQLNRISETHKVATALRRVGKTDKANKACRVLINDMRIRLVTVQAAIDAAELAASNAMIFLAYSGLSPETVTQ